MNADTQYLRQGSRSESICARQRSWPNTKWIAGELTCRFLSKNMPNQSWGVCVATSIALTACSTFAIKRLPSPLVQGAKIECTDSMTYPFIDMGGTVVAGSLAISSFSADSNKDKTPTVGLVLGIVALGTVISALYGTKQVGRCREAQTAQLSSPQTFQAQGADSNQETEQGARCQPGDDCAQGLRCDPTMQVCVLDDEGATP